MIIWAVTHPGQCAFLAVFTVMVTLSWLAADGYPRS